MVLALGRGAPRALGFEKSVGLDHRNSTGLRETETPLLEGTHTHKLSCVPGPREKAVISQEPQSDLSTGLGGSPGETGASSSSLWGQGH